MSMSTSVAMAQAVGTQPTGDAGFTWGTLLLFVGGAIMLAFFCSLGLIARLREHKIEQRADAAKAAKALTASEQSHTADVTDQLADTVGHQHGQRPPDDDAQYRP